VSTTDNDQAGQCLCGAVTFVASVQANQPHFHACHCEICRRWSGGPTMMVSASNVSFTGEDLIRRYASSEWAERGFCSRCGTNLFFYLKEQDHYEMSVGAFNSQHDLSLTQEIYIDSKPSGYSFSGNHPRLTEAEFLASIGQGPG